MPEYRKILLDTNFLMIPGNLGVDILKELDRVCNFNYKLYIVDKSLDELKKLPEKARKEKTTTKIAVNIAFKLIELLTKEGKINIIPAKTDERLKDKYVDDVIKSLADEYIIATTDSELKKHLKRMIILRGKNHLELIDNTI